MPLKRRATQSVTRTAVTLAERESLDIYAYILWSSDNTRERKKYENDHPTEPCEAVDAHFRNIWTDEISYLKKRDYYVRAKTALETSGVSSPSRALNTQLGIVRDAKPAYSSFVTVNNSVNLVSSSPTNDSKLTLCRNQDTPDITCGQKVPNKQEEDQDMLRQKLIDLQRQLSRSDYDAFLQEYLRDFEAARNQLCANSGAGLDLTSKGNSSNGQELNPLGFMDAKDEGCGGSSGVVTSTFSSSLITSGNLSASCRSRLETAGRQMLLEKIGAWQQRVAQQRLLQKEIKERQEVQRRYKDLVSAYLARKNTNANSTSIDINFTALDILCRALSCLDNGETADTGDKLPVSPHLQQSGGGESKDNSNESSSRLSQLLADLVDIEKTDREATTASVLWPTRVIDERLIDIETYLLAPSLSGFARLSLGGEEHVVPLVDNTVLQDQLLCEASVLDALPVLGQDDLDACLGTAYNDDSMFPKETESTYASAAAAAATVPLFFNQELSWRNSQQQLPVATAHWYQTTSSHVQLPQQLSQFQSLEPPVWHRQPMQVSPQAELLPWQQHHQQLHCQSPHQYQYEYAASQQLVWDHGQGQDCAHLHQHQLYDQQPQHQWLHRQRLPSISLPATGVTGDKRLSPPHPLFASHHISVMAHPRRQLTRFFRDTISFNPNDAREWPGNM